MLFIKSHTICANSVTYYYELILLCISVSNARGDMAVLCRVILLLTLI